MSATPADAVITDIVMESEDLYQIYIQLTVISELLGHIFIVLVLIFAFMVFVYVGQFVYNNIFKYHL